MAAARQTREKRATDLHGSSRIRSRTRKMLDPRRSVKSVAALANATATRKNSQQWFERAQQSLVEGVNSPSRGAAVYSPGPVFLERGQGSHVWDADGNEYVDFMMSFGALIQGHAHPRLVEVVSQTMARRLAFRGRNFRRSRSSRAVAPHGSLRRGGALRQHRQRSHHAGPAPGPRPHWPDEVPQIRRPLPRLVRSLSS